MLGAFVLIIAAFATALALNYVLEPEMRELVKDLRNAPR